MSTHDSRIAPADSSDLPALVTLERLCSPHPWSESALRAVLSGTAGESVLVARAAHDPADLRGFCVSRAVAGEVEVHEVGVHPAHRRQGLARRLLETALGSAAATGACVAHLEVRAGNAAAIALYEVLGFRLTGRRKDYYASPTEDALLYSAALPLSPHTGEQT